MNTILEMHCGIEMDCIVSLQQGMLSLYIHMYIFTYSFYPQDA
jgi:hypothetical protein